jgi:hypothetical protein
LRLQSNLSTCSLEQSITASIAATVLSSDFMISLILISSSSSLVALQPQRVITPSLS